MLCSRSLVCVNLCSFLGRDAILHQSLQRQGTRKGFRSWFRLRGVEVRCSDNLDHLVLGRIMKGGGSGWVSDKPQSPRPSAMGLQPRHRTPGLEEPACPCVPSEAKVCSAGPSSRSLSRELALVLRRGHTSADRGWETKRGPAGVNSCRAVETGSAAYNRVPACPSPHHVGQAQCPRAKTGRGLVTSPQVRTREVRDELAGRGTGWSSQPRLHPFDHTCSLLAPCHSC